MADENLTVEESKGLAYTISSDAMPDAQALIGSIVAVIDDAGARNLGTANSYFTKSMMGERGVFLLETPLGETGRVEGRLILNPNLKEYSSHYFYAELTDLCQFRCPECGVRDEIDHTGIEDVTLSNTRYMTEEFAAKLAESMGETPFTELRPIYWGGGEPLINPVKFGRVHRLFNVYNRNLCSVITNGLSIPLDEDALEGFVRVTGLKPGDEVKISLSQNHIGEYVKRIKSGKADKRYLPEADKPEEALPAKIILVREMLEPMGIVVSHIRIERDGENREDLRLDLLLATYEKYSRFPKSKRRESAEYLIKGDSSLTRNGSRKFDGDEFSIRSTGEMFPHCYDIFDKEKKHRMGFLGILRGISK
jgi:hypothetical protein